MKNRQREAGGNPHPRGTNGRRPARTFSSLSRKKVRAGRPWVARRWRGGPVPSSPLTIGNAPIFRLRGIGPHVQGTVQGDGSPVFVRGEGLARVHQGSAGRPRGDRCRKRTPGHRSPTEPTAAIAATGPFLAQPLGRTLGDRGRRSGESISTRTVNATAGTVPAERCLAATATAIPHFPKTALPSLRDGEKKAAKGPIPLRKQTVCRSAASAGELQRASKFASVTRQTLDRMANRGTMPDSGSRRGRDLERTRCHEKLLVGGCSLCRDGGYRNGPRRFDGLSIGGRLGCGQ